METKVDPKWAQFIELWALRGGKRSTADDLVCMARDAGMADAMLGAGNTNMACESKVHNALRALRGVVVRGKLVMRREDVRTHRVTYWLEAEETIKPEEIRAEEQRLVNDAQDRVLGEMARTGVRFDQFDQFFFDWTNFKSRSAGEMTNAQVISAMDEMDAVTVKLKAAVQAMRRVAEGAKDVTMEEITMAGLLLGRRWTFEAKR